MAKVKMICPISKTVCIDCPIYRGRHFYMCFSNGYNDESIEKDQLKALKESLFGKKEREDLSFEVPDEILNTDLKCIHNVEDVVFEKEFKK